MENTFKHYGNYDPYPKVTVKNVEHPVIEGFSAIANQLTRLITDGKRIIIIDLYPGVDKKLYTEKLKHIAKIIDIEAAMLDEKSLHAKFDENVTADLVFGLKTYKNLVDCFDQEKLTNIQNQLIKSTDPTILIGVGAGLVAPCDCYIYANISRREIQLGYQNGASNWLWNTSDLRDLAKTKQAYFVEWVIADKHKDDFYNKIDYMIDANEPTLPKMISGTDIRKGLIQLSKEPFRLKPFFASGIWGGQWMKTVFNLDRSQDNCAWCFDGVPEENSLLLSYGKSTVEIPAIDLVLNHPENLLGDKVYGRYGKEFPIRFNLLDLMDGGNLSLQVHPTTEYAQKTFGAYYTQDESYYILDAKEDSCVYLGVKDNTNKEIFTSDLLLSETGEKKFDDARFINKFPVKKHDHFSIPGGTIHSAGKNTMVLEISATPNIYTFKLWDWGRVDKNGLPRPTHTHHGLNNIKWERNTSWIKANLLPKNELIYNEDSLNIFKTGLHNREPLETHRLDFSKEITCDTKNNLQVMNLVEGKEIEIHSTDGSFCPFTVHYAETVIIPAALGSYKIIPKPEVNGDFVKVVVAFVR